MAQGWVHQLIGGGDRLLVGLQRNEALAGNGHPLRAAM